MSHPSGDRVDVENVSITTSGGSSLSCWVRGAGPLLVLVHGSATDHRCFDPILDLLDGYRVAAYDRRGHGRSGGAATADILAEADDLRRVIEDLKPPGQTAFLLAYSYGALISLHALMRQPVPVQAAVLYEPPMGDPEMLPAVDEVMRLLEDGDTDRALGLFVASTFHLPERVVDAMRREPMWEVGLAHVTNLRAELNAVELSDVPLAACVVPPLRVLAAERGGNPAFVRIAERIRAAVHRCDVVKIPGLPHFAISTEPNAFVVAARAHFDQTGGASGISQ